MSGQSKNFTQSVTIHVNAVIATLGVILVSLPELLTQALATLGSAEMQQLIALLPADAQQVVQSVTRVLGAAITLFAAINSVVRVVRTKQPVEWPKLPGAGALLLPLALVLLGGCGSAPSDVARRIKIQPIDCAAITSPEKANEALAAGQIVRIAARDLVAALYPSVLDAAAVRAFDEKVDRPFTEAYANAREFVDSGRLGEFKAMCEDFAAALQALVPVVETGGGQ